MRSCCADLICGRSESCEPQRKRFVDRWIVEDGSYLVEVGASSRDLRGKTRVEVVGDEVHTPLSRESTVGEILAHPIAGTIVQAQLAGMRQLADDAMDAAVMTEDAMSQLMMSFPTGRLAGFPSMGVTREQVDQLIALGNAR